MTLLRIYTLDTRYYCAHDIIAHIHIAHIVLLHIIPYGLTFHAKQDSTQTHVSSFLIVEPPQ